MITILTLNYNSHIKLIVLLKKILIKFFFFLEKVYNRQFSAPILKRKSSKFGLGQLISYTLPNNSLKGKIYNFNKKKMYMIIKFYK